MGLHNLQIFFKIRFLIRVYSFSDAMERKHVFLMEERVRVVMDLGDVAVQMRSTIILVAPATRKSASR